MSDYSKSTNFTAKDGLSSGDPNKRINGALFDSEFDPISTAVASKIDKVAGETGEVPKFTSSGGLESTGLTIAAIWPVGSVYINAAVSTNPSTLLGFGTWVAFGEGRVLTGLDSGNTNFDTVEETGGSADAVAIAHTHTTATDGNHSHTYQQTKQYGGPYELQDGGLTWGYVSTSTTGTGAHSHAVETSGVVGTDLNLQPYITVYMWKRTA
jgi:hypothetical protein